MLYNYYTNIIQICKLKYISGDYLNPDDKKRNGDCYEGGHVGHSVGRALNL